MDTLTHALSGALVGYAAGPRRVREGVPPAVVRAWVGFWAAAFPDIDFFLRLVDTERYLEVHRAETHSFLLLPLWALLIGTAFYFFYRRRYRLHWLAVIAGLGIAIHILGDVITAYGTYILAPLSDHAPALGWVLVIDPWLTALLVVAVYFAWAWRHPGVPWFGLFAVCAYVLFQAGLNDQAARLGEARAVDLGWEDAEVRALAQPLSPFNRAVIVEHGERIERARFNLLRRQTPEVNPGHPVLWQLHRSYRPVDDPLWRRYHHFPQEGEARVLAMDAWESRGMRWFRRFAHHPVFYGIDGAAGETCVWFTDLRYWYDPLTSSFRYGTCRDHDDAEWQLYERTFFRDRIRRAEAPG